jgi:PAS domain S-box-containing protein
MDRKSVKTHKNNTVVKDNFNQRKRAEKAPQKKMEERLRFEEKRFRSIAENSLDIIVLLNREGVVTYINRAIEKTLGFKPEERIGANGLDLVHPDDLKSLTDEFNILATDTNSPVIYGETRLRHKNGRWYTFETVGSNLVHNNVVEAVIVNHRDITKRKKAETSLRQEQQFSKLVLDNLPGIFYLFTYPEKRLVFWNKQSETLLGYSVEEMQGRLITEWLPPENRELALQAIEEAMEKGHNSMETPVITKNGHQIPFFHTGIKFETHGQSYFVGIGVDITESKKTEEELKKSEEKYRSIFENAMEGIYQSTTEGRFITVNGALSRMAGYDSPEEFIESIKDIGTQLYVHPEDRKRFLEIMAKKGFINNFEVELCKKDGSIFWVVINSRIVKNEQGEILYTEGLIEDITRRKNAEKQLHKSLESLKKAVGATIQVLTSALRIRDPYTAGHQSRSSHLAWTIAREMGLPQEKIDGIQMAGSIHDIGKLAVPTEILTKPSKLTDIEFSLIKEHSKSGYETLRDVESPWPLAEIVHQHHERINGSGYPRKLKENEILMEARILAVADVVEAMSSHRPYRASLGIEVALKEIEKNKGILYDDAVSDACLKLFREKGYQLT